MAENMRVRCINDHWNKNLKDPDLTQGKFYDVLDKNVLIMNQDTHYSILGDNGEQIDRPKSIFETTQEFQNNRKKAAVTQNKSSKK